MRVVYMAKCKRSAARAAAAGPFSWDRIAEQTAAVYERVRA